MLDLVAQHASIRDEVLRAVSAVVERQAFIMGAEVVALEEAVARLSQTRFAIGCASGTDALLLPLRALGLKPGDEVITAPFTFFATAGAVHNAGARPVFVDIEPDTFNINPDAIEAAITPKTRAIIPVHLFGQMAAMERIMPIARRHNLAVIEDAAQSIGSRRKIDGTWRMSGEIGTCGTLSFFPSKNLGGWGDGGMILTQDEALAARLRTERLHGGSKQYFHDDVGLNSRLDTLQAAVLLAKLPRLAGWSEARRRHAAYYNAAWVRSSSVRPPVIDPANEHIYNQYTLRVPRRDALQKHLQAEGIGCSIYYPLPLHLQPCFAYLGYQAGSMPESERAAQEVLSLPVYPELTTAQQDTVIDAVNRFYA